MSKEKEIYRHYYRIAGITIQVESDMPITDDTFYPRFDPFRVDGPGEENAIFRHHFSLPNIDDWSLGKLVYQRLPWNIYRNEDSWVYVGILPDELDNKIWKVAVFNDDHTKGEIYSPHDKVILHMLTSFPSDQIVIARMLANKDACYLHSSGMIIDGAGLVFVGHADAGKSTMLKLLNGKGEILCDDRIIVRKHPDGFKAHGSWSHGEITIVSSNSAPLKAIIFLEQSKENRLIPLYDKREIMSRLLACLVKPVLTPDWWEKMMDLVAKMVNEIPFYTAKFDKSGRIVDPIKHL